MQKLNRFWDSTPFRRGRPQEATQLEESGGSEEADAAGDSNDPLDDEEAEAARRKLGPMEFEDAEFGEDQGTGDSYDEDDDKVSLGDSGNKFNDGALEGEVDEAASAVASAAWESRDREPLLAAAAAVAAESDTSGDIDLDDEDDDDVADFNTGATGLASGFNEFFRGAFSSGLSGPGGVFNGGFVDDEASATGDDEYQEGADVELFDGGDELEEDGEEGDEGEEDGEEDGENSQEFDEDDDEDEQCFGADAISAGAGTSLTEVQAQRPQPKIVGYLETEMKFENKSNSLNVRILQVELRMALTKFRRKSNKKMRWSMLQVCMTLLPEKTVIFRTPMVEHEDPKKKSLLPLAAAVDGAGADKEGEADKDKDKDTNQDKDNKSGNKEKGKKGKKMDAEGKSVSEAGKSGDAAKPPVVKIGKLSFPKLTGKAKAKEEAAAGAAAERNNKKSVLAAIAARKAAQLQQQQERREQHLKQQQVMKERLRQERLKRKQAAGNKPTDEPLKDVTKFSKSESEVDKTVKKISLKQTKEQDDKEMFKFTPIYHYHVRKNSQQSLAIRFRLYGCWRKKRSFLLGENTFALERLEETIQANDKVRRNRFRLQLEERRFAISKLKHLSDSDDEAEQHKVSSKAKKSAKDAVDALLLPPPTEGPALVSQPELFLGLAYNQVNGHLQVAIVKACNLRNPRSDKPPTAFVKVQLLWGLSQDEVLFRSKTLSIADCPNPAWHETFEYPVSRAHLKDVSVMAKVYCKHTLNRTVSIGWCSVGRNNCSEEALDHWSDMRDANGQQISKWHVLLRVSKEKTEGQLDSD